ncbi:MAG: 8-oxo-dGTP diphosphatase [Bacillota bacterium]|nr:8-oxo-dGTP diphosphatase [Bacillota bacterium]
MSSLIYVRKDGKTLMLRRDKKDAELHGYKYNGVGGKLERGESPEDCAFREIREETGLTAKSLVFRGHLTFPYFDDVVDWLVFVYECYDFEGEIVESDEGSLHWIDDENIMKINIYEGDKVFLDVLYNSTDNFYGTFLYKHGEFVDATLHRIALKA